MTDARPASEGGTLNYPALTIEAQRDRPVRVKWINGLVDETGNYLPHLFAVDQTLHWANPAGGPGGTDTHGMDADALHGAGPDRDARARRAHHRGERRLPGGLVSAGRRQHPRGLRHRRLVLRASRRRPRRIGPGVGARFGRLPVPERPARHDPLVPRPLAGDDPLNVYAGPGRVLPGARSRDKVRQRLPRPAPARGDKPGPKYHEIPIAIQDRSFNADGSLFYPDNRAFFEGLNVPGRPEQPRARAADPVHPRHGPGRADERHLAPVEPRVLRQHDGRQRQDLALSGRRAAPLPLPPAQRHRVPVPDPQDQQRRALQADRQRGRLPAESPSVSRNC